MPERRVKQARNLFGVIRFALSFTFERFGSQTGWHVGLLSCEFLAVKSSAAADDVRLFRPAHVVAIPRHGRFLAG